MVIRFCTLATAGLILVASVLAPAAQAQRGGDRGGFGGRDGGDRGGRGGGDRGGVGGRGGGGAPTDFLSRLDQNGDGVLSPDESQGRASFMIQRLLPSANLSRPIPMSELQQAVERMRTGGGADRGRGGERDRGGDSRNDSRSSTTEEEPLVLGFGSAGGLPSIPGFGEDAELFAVSITSADRSYAERTLGRYDENKDGQLDSREIGRGRWSGDPKEFDQNKDGRLTISELAVRYARRRTDQGSSSSSSREQSNRGASSRDAQSTEDRRRELMARFAGRTGGDRGGFTGRGGFGARGGFDRGRDESSSASSDDEQEQNSSAPPQIQVYTMKTAHERLPSGLPSWFRERDKNQDGQIMMSEFATAWSDSVVSDFTQFDENGDGVITPAECLSAKDRGARSTAVASATSSGSSYTSTSRSTGGSSSSSSGSSGSGSAPAAASDDKLARYMQYAESIFKKYDTNGNGSLTAGEWSAMSRSPEAADTNGDGEVSLEEYARSLIR